MSLVPPGRRRRERHPSHEIGWHAWSRAFESLVFFWRFCRVWPCSVAVAACALGSLRLDDPRVPCRGPPYGHPGNCLPPAPRLTVSGHTRPFRELAETSASPLILL